MTTSLAVRTRPQQSAPLSAMGAVPLVRVRRAPQFEPPYDDELVPPGGRVPFPDPDPDPGSRPDSWPEADGVPGAGAGPAAWAEPVSETYPGREAVDDASSSAAGGVPPRSGTGRHAAYRYVALCLEVLEGFRPVAHLRRLTVPSAFDSVAGELARPVARAGHRPPDEAMAGRRPGATAPAVQRGVPVRPAPGAAGTPAAPGRPPTGTPARPRPAGGQSGAVDRIRLRRLRLAEPRDGAVEVVAVLGRSGRFWALALRLEHRDDAWLCTHVEVV